MTKITPEQIARVAEIKEGLAKGIAARYFESSYEEMDKLYWGSAKAPEREMFLNDADSLLRTVLNDVPVGGELLQTGRAPEDTAYKAQHDADSVTIGDVLKEARNV